MKAVRNTVLDSGRFFSTSYTSWVSCFSCIELIISDEICTHKIRQDKGTVHRHAQSLAAVCAYLVKVFILESASAQELKARIGRA